MLNSEYEVVDETLQLVNSILQILEFPIEIQPESVKALFDEKIYMEIASVLFPFLQYNLLQIDKKKAQAGDKIDMLIQLLQNDIVKRDLKHISGAAIATGNMKHVFNLVSVLFELTKRHAQVEDDEEEEEGSEQEGEHSEQVHSVLGIDNEFEDHQENAESPKQKAHQYHHLVEGNEIIEDKVAKIKKMQEQPKKSDQFSQSYGDFLQRKHKDTSNTKGANAVRSPKSVKQTIKKQIESGLFAQQTNKKLINKPKIRAVVSAQKLSPAQKAFNKDVYTQVSKVRNKFKTTNNLPKSPDQHLRKKTKQLHYVLKDQRQRQRLKQNYTGQEQRLKRKNQQKKIRALKIKQIELRKRMVEQQKAIQLKLRDQKSRYLQKMYYFDNSLVQRLEKDRDLCDRKQFREKLLDQNKATTQRLQALENHYQNEIKLLKQRQSLGKIDRKIIENAHRNIIHKLEQQLKAQSESKIMKLQDYYREEYEKMTEFQAIEKDLIRLYKKY